MDMEMKDLKDFAFPIIRRDLYAGGPPLRRSINLRLEELFGG